MPTLRPESPEEVQEAVRAYPRLRAQGGGTKPALSTPKEGEVLLDLSRLRGLLAYEPEEFVFTAFAGTPIAEKRATSVQPYLGRASPPTAATNSCASGASSPGRAPRVRPV